MTSISSRSRATRQRFLGSRAGAAMLALCSVVCIPTAAQTCVARAVADAYPPLDPVTHLPVAPGDPYRLLAEPGIPGDAIHTLVDTIEVTVGGIHASTGALPADGQSLVPVTIRLLDNCGQPVKGRVLTKISTGSLRIAPRPDSPDSSAKRMGTDEIEVVDGVAEVFLIAPMVPGQVGLSVRVGAKEARGQLAFVPDLRPLIAVGLVEGVLNLGQKVTQSVVPSAGLNDGFELALRRFSREFGNGDTSLAGRGAFFIKGAIKGDTLLTATYDTDKPLPSHVLANINPDKYYPVMGDSAQRGMDARSTSRLYVRLDNDKNYVLFGDFATGDGFSQMQGGTGVGPLQQRNLGQYNRSMTGLRFHREDADGYLDGFVKRDSLRQAIEEYAGTGTSGPYSVGSLYAVENSEKLEVVVRDRVNPSRILSVRALVPFVDYTFTPFSGQILLTSPLSALDANLNPVSLRITYEVDNQNDPFYVAGISGQRRMSESVELGGSFMKSTNHAPPSGGLGYVSSAGSAVAVPMELRELMSVNGSFKPNETTRFVVEMAQSTSATPTGDAKGNAFRFDSHSAGTYTSPANGAPGLRYETRIWGGWSGKDFNNPAASYTLGRSDAGLKSAIELSSQTRLMVEASKVEDRATQGQRSGESVQLEHAIDSRWTLDLGARHLWQNANNVSSLGSSYGMVSGLPGQGSIFGNSAGLNPAGAGFFGMGGSINPVTGQPQSMLNGQIVGSGLKSAAMDATTYRAGVRYRVTDQLRLGLEVGQDKGFKDDPTWVALSADYRFVDGRVFGRYEAPTGRATAGGDYKIAANTSLYGRVERTNGLASSYSLEAAPQSSAFILGVRQAEQGLENYSELRQIADGMNADQLQSATGLRNTFTLRDGLKANWSAERLSILNGAGRSASALGAGLEWTDAIWRASTRLEWRQLERSPGAGTDDGQTSWMNTLSLARKLDDSWTALVRNYYLQTRANNLPGHQLQDRFQLGAAYRPVDDNRFDALFRWEAKTQVNQQIDPTEESKAQILSANLNFHPTRPWWHMARLATKQVNDRIAGVSDSYQAWLVSGRSVYDVSKHWDLGAMFSVMGSSKGSTKQYAYGAEIGYLMQENMWASVGYNASGFSDPDLTGSDYTRKGLYLRLRVKFDETTLQRAAGAMKVRFTEERQ